MKKHNVFFWGAAFFLFGVFLASIGLSFLTSAILAALLAAVFCVSSLIINKKILIWFSALSLIAAVGSGYYWVDDALFRDFDLPFGQKTTIRAVIVSDPSRGTNSQRFFAEAESPHRGRIEVYTQRFPEFSYGDLIEISGRVEKPQPESYAKWLAKNRVGGVVHFADVKRIGSGRGSAIKRVLFSIKRSALSIFPKTLAPEKSAFLAGITLGERASFSEDFKLAMNLSGTTHLVALSGYNVTIIAAAISWMLGSLMNRRVSFILTVLFVVLFVIMSGGESSIVRAAVMGVIAFLADQVNRVYFFRNAVMAAAFLMVLFNPKVMMFDLGFQLSFLALMGIIYLKPAIRKVLKISPEKGFLAWRENTLTTISAQLAVIPVLLSNFGVFSPMSFLANVLILEAVPITMFLGFLMMAAGFLSYYAALSIGFLANLFLSYELGLIRFFAGLDFAVVRVEHFGLLASVLYFAAVLGFIWYSKKIQL